jgi:C1A family cysteine protease
MYPYSGQDQSSRNIQCNTQIVQSNIYNVSRLRIRDRGFINGGDCYSLVKQLTTHALAVTISTSGFQFYIKGTYDNTDESPNHGVTLVGYDPINGYKIKNSWGTTWGMIGYAYVT